MVVTEDMVIFALYIIVLLFNIAFPVDMALTDDGEV